MVFAAFKHLRSYNAKNIVSIFFLLFLYVLLVYSMRHWRWYSVFLVPGFLCRRQALLDNKIVGSDVIEKIFHKISAILQCHRLFQMALSVAASAWDKNEEIGGTFVASVNN